MTTLTLLALIAGLPSSIFILIANDTSSSVAGRIWATLLKQTAFVYILSTILLLINMLSL